MIIDVHTHIGFYINSAEDLQQPVLSAEGLISMMDRNNIDMACVLPLVSPESSAVMTSQEEVIKKCSEYPGRLVPFANIDPRSCLNTKEADFSFILKNLMEQGCKGVGEVTANLPITDERVVNLCAQCGKASLPVTFHLTHKQGECYGLVDTIHMPGLETLLQNLPETLFLGHAPAFWAEISGDVTEEDRAGYPEKPVREGGRVQELLDRYPNLYCDLSADSGLNALTRDKAHAEEFIETYKHRLLFGSDYLRREAPDPPLLSFLKELNISPKAYSLITGKNAEKLYDL